MSTVLYLNGRIHTPADPTAEAMLVDGDTVGWVGSQDAAAGITAERTVDLGGALVTPAFVDAHVHCLDTGLHLLGVDLTGATSVADILDLVAAAATARPEATVLGHGWDESLLAEGRPPTAAELDRATGGTSVYLSRIDVHSAVVSGRLVAGADLQGRQGWAGDGLVRGDAHHAARAAARALPASHRRDAHRAALQAAAATGIGYVHEMSGPDLGGPDDLPALLATAAELGVAVTAYWGQPAGADPAATAAASGAAVAGLAGDLCVDGSLGSRTAALREPYADAETTGLLYLSAEDVADHVRACGRAGIQAGFHVIGDEGLDAVIDGLDRVAAEPGGTGVVRRARVRLEHVESADDDQIAALLRHAVTASVQPAFDAAWGGPDGMYARRLGARAAGLNRFASMAAAGVPLAFGSDSPVTPFDPWGAVAAAIGHHNPDERISARAAFAAHTRGAHRAAVGPAPGRPRGVLAPGAAASFAVWSADELVVWAPDDRIQAWSTDPRSGTPALPDLSPGAPRPQCLRTVVDGIVVYEGGHLP